MTLSLKQKAMLITTGVITGTVLFSGLIAFVLKNVPAETIGNLCLFSFISWMVYLFYGVTLNRLEYQETLKKMNEKG